MENLLPKLVEDCRSFHGYQFIFQQNGAPAHGAKLAQEWFALIEKDSWPPNSPDLNPLDYAVWGAVLSKNRRKLRNLMINCKKSGMIHDLRPFRHVFLGLGNAYSLRQRR